ncbi:RDD domain containing protein [Vogesella sp. EB]|uniref:RDD family protein n=1 Tax=Vogesella sp. EB TaxID=1526735 RepID=UPI00064D4E2A|nr:RDD family protein [Vogesella sp. EB]KMJ52236.1 RDD domain containing protein [Vogesella sp. EB]
MNQHFTHPGLLRRLASLCYEALLLGAVLLVAAALFTPLVVWSGNARWMSVLMQLFLALVMFGYFGYCWTRGGQTLAMKPWRLQLTLADGGALRWPHAAMRFVVALVLYLGVPALAYTAWQPLFDSRQHALAVALLWDALPVLWALIDNDKQFLHDRLAGTRLRLLPPLARKR